MRSIVIALSIVCLAAGLAAQTDDDRERNVAVASVSVTPDSTISSENLHVIRDEIQSHTYGSYLPEISERARYALQTQGHFRARVGDPKFTVLSESAGRKTIAVTLAVDQGEQYRLKEITLSKNTVFLSPQLHALFPINNGDVFDVEKIRVGLEGIRKLYASKGYINATPVPNTDADDASRLVSLDIELDEGGQYRFGGLVLEGVEPRPGAGHELLAAWKPQIGKVYDSTVVENFWKEHFIPLFPPRTPLDGAIQQIMNSEDHIVFFKVEFP